jgi:hypothetical protein
VGTLSSDHETQRLSAEAPVLLIVWNRPAETRLVLESLRRARPKRLFVAGDGPREGSDSDARLIAETQQAVAELVDWPCDLRTSYSEDNQGCRRAVVRAIDWFFANVPAGIILEDDCVPHPDFFAFCSLMLDRFWDDTRIMSIAGDNSAGVSSVAGQSYCFVRYPHIWGWATWRRAWRLYDRDLELWDMLRESGQEGDVFSFDAERETWVPIFNRLRDEGVPDTWDWQWAATCFLHSGLSVQPTVNLVRNVGFNQSATHTTGPSPRADCPTRPILPLSHPRAVIRSRIAERDIFWRTQAELNPRLSQSSLQRGWRMIRRRAWEIRQSWS